MKKKIKKGKNTSNHRNLTIYAGALSLLMLPRLAGAQSVLSPLPAYSTTPAALQAAQNDEMDVFATPPSTEAQPLKWGPVTLRPHVNYQFSYADGILANPGQPVSTTIQQIAPGVLMDIGDHWTLDYTPSWNLYSSDQLSDSFNQSASLNWGGAYNDWVLSASQSYVSSSSTTVETGTQTKQENYLTSVTADYTINSKLSLDLSAAQNFNFADQFTDTREWSTLDWLNYQFWPRLNVALGIELGYDDVENSPDMLFEQYQARVQWRATDKISFQLHGGLEDRQFFGSDENDLVTPVYDGTIQYQPFSVTKLSVSAQRNVSFSFFQGQATENTSFTGDWNQRLLGKFFMNLNGGYEITKYTASAATVIADREDHYSFVNVQINTTFLKRGTVAAFYQYAHDDSSSAGFGFNSREVGFQIGYAY
ncbi:MAG TPA: hypothetical protein VHG89_02860 [Verrucomicrobiae bacterium]|nr:hypothetical protein [Verrucomicrobiae bacterium]